MPRYRRKTGLVTKAAELAFATPQVVGYRLMRMALAGAAPTARDRREFQRMSTEKMTAFAESWNAMIAHAVRTNYKVGAEFWTSWLGGKPSQFDGAQVCDAALAMLGKGIAPIHRRAVANAKRLGGVGRR